MQKRTREQTKVENSALHDIELHDRYFLQHDCQIGGTSATLLTVAAPINTSLAATTSASMNRIHIAIITTNGRTTKTVVTVTTATTSMLNSTTAIATTTPTGPANDAAMCLPARLSGDQENQPGCYYNEYCRKSPKPDCTMFKRRGVSVHPTAPNPWGHCETNFRSNPRAVVVRRHGLPACRGIVPNAWRLT